MIMKQGFVRGAVSGGLLGSPAGVAVMTAPAGAEDVAVNTTISTSLPNASPRRSEPSSSGRTRTIFYTASVRPPRRSSRGRSTPSTTPASYNSKEVPDDD
jgi:hypothetical protein